MDAERTRQSMMLPKNVLLKPVPCIVTESRVCKVGFTDGNFPFCFDRRFLKQAPLCVQV